MTNNQYKQTIREHVKEKKQKTISLLQNHQHKKEPRVRWRGADIIEKLNLNVPFLPPSYKFLKMFYKTKMIKKKKGIK